MTKDRNMDDILSHCLDLLAVGETVEASAARYPEHRDELLPLLRVAAATRGAVSSISYRPEAKVRGLFRLNEALAEQQASGRRRWPQWAWLTWSTKPLAVGLAITVLVSGGAFGTAAASADSVPGDPLYCVKTTRERVSLMMPQSNMSRAERHVQLARVRGQEMSVLVGRGRFADAEQLVERIARHMNESATFVGLTGPTSPIEMPAGAVHIRDTRGARRFETHVNRTRDIVNAALLKTRPRVSPSSRYRLDMLRHRSELRFRVVLAALEGKTSQTWGPIWATEPPGRAVTMQRR